MNTVADRAKRPMKISELSRITGIGRDTIHFYIKEGLLPKPVKTSRNSAYYDESYVRRIGMIRELQSKRFLPLQVIKQILDEKGNEVEGGCPTPEELETIVHLDEKYFNVPKSSANSEFLTREELAKRTGLTFDEIGKLRELEVLVPEEGFELEVFGEDSIRIAEIWGEARKAGFTEDRGFLMEEWTKMYRDVMDVLSKKELLLFVRNLAGKVSGEEAAKMAEIAVRVATEMTGLLRKQAISRMVKEYGQVIRAIF